MRSSRSSRCCMLQGGLRSRMRRRRALVHRKLSKPSTEHPYVGVALIAEHLRDGVDRGQIRELAGLVPLDEHRAHGVLTEDLLERASLLVAHLVKRLGLFEDVRPDSRVVEVLFLTGSDLLADPRFAGATKVTENAAAVTASNAAATARSESRPGPRRS